ncbi:MAG TPA: PDZ domain-containing protein, partial [Gemmataceae bacterium]|nr:PDZ domain-containing protein [Gemmataceae bacterium]
VEQLDLPKGQGWVITRVLDNSAAAKAGIKANDIFLELNGKPVPNDESKFFKLLDDVKANTPVDAVVLRKGKRETIKGLSLPEAKAVKPQVGEGFPGGGFGIGGFQPGGVAGFGGFPGQQGGIGFGGFGGGPGQVMTTMIRTDDRFTTRYQEGSLIITLTGTVADGKAKLGAIHVQDGNDSKRYESVDKVPEQYRDKVKHLVETSEKGSVRVEIKTNPGKKPDDDEKKP